MINVASYLLYGYLFANYLFYKYIIYYNLIYIKILCLFNIGILHIEHLFILTIHFSHEKT
jgi:hypothetical protein